MRWVRWLAGAAFLVCLALSVWLGLSVQSLKFNREIDPGAVLAAIATVFSTATTLVLVYWVNYLFVTQSASRKAETEILLDVARDVKKALAELRASAEFCRTSHKLTPGEQQRLLETERELSNSVLSLDMALQLCPEPGITLEKLKDARGALKDALEDSPFPGPYDSASTRLIRSAFRQFANELIAMMLLIARR